MNKCPNCGRKLSPFYFKSECPDCGINLLYFNLSESLMNDRIKAEKEESSVRRFLYGIKFSSIGSLWGILKIAVFVVQLVLLLLNMFKTSIASWEEVNLISVIKEIITGSQEQGFGDYLLNTIMADNTLKFVLLSFVSIIIMGLICLIFQLFVYTLWGCITSIILTVLSCILYLIFALNAIAYEAMPAVGYYFEVALILVQLVLLLPMKFNLNKKMANYRIEEKEKHEKFMERVEEDRQMEKEKILSETDNQGTENQGA